MVAASRIPPRRVTPPNPLLPPLPQPLNDIFLVFLGNCFRICRRSTSRRSLPLYVGMSAIMTSPWLARTCGRGSRQRTLACEPVQRWHDRGHDSAAGLAASRSSDNSGRSTQASSWRRRTCARKARGCTVFDPTPPNCGACSTRPIARRPRPVVQVRRRLFSKRRHPPPALVSFVIFPSSSSLRPHSCHLDSRGACR